MILIAEDEPNEIKILLQDIGMPTRLDDEDDYVIIGRDHSFGAQRKTVSDLLSSFASGQLYDQLLRLQDKYDIVALLLEGVLAPERNGKLKTFGFETGWDYISVQGILFSIALHGVMIVQAPSLFATTLTLRTIHKQLTEPERKFQYRAPKIRSFTRIPEPVKVLCSFPGINVKLARQIFKHHGSIAEAIQDIINGGSSTLQIPGVGKGKLKAIQDVLFERYQAPGVGNVQVE